jgi:hypothetical protein
MAFNQISRARNIWGKTSPRRKEESQAKIAGVRITQRDGREDRSRPPLTMLIPLKLSIG